MYPATEPKLHTGDEAILTPSGESVCTLLDFWRWAYSDLMSNAERGTLAEFLVACALGLHQHPRISWGRYDLLTKDGISVEVKSSGYLQTWEQKTLSRPIFGIQPTFGWDSITNTYEDIKRRQADIYVFCLHKHTEQETTDPLRISQWDFYLLPTSVLNLKLGNQKTASLSALLQAGAELCSYEHLDQRIKELIKPEDSSFSPLTNPKSML